MLRVTQEVVSTFILVSERLRRKNARTDCYAMSCNKLQPVIRLCCFQVWEWSPNHGLSTIFILAALADNGHGQLVAFDENENWHDSEACIADLLEDRFRFIHVRAASPLYHAKGGGGGRREG